MEKGHGGLLPFWYVNTCQHISNQINVPICVHFAEHPFPLNTALFSSIYIYICLSSFTILSSPGLSAFLIFFHHLLCTSISPQILLPLLLNWSTLSFLYFTVSPPFTCCLLIHCSLFSFFSHFCVRFTLCVSPPSNTPLYWAFWIQNDQALQWNKNFCITWSSEFIVILDPRPAFQTQIVD